MREAESMSTVEHAAPAARSPMFSDILCAVDGRDADIGAAEQAVALAGPGGRVTSLLVTSHRGAGGAHRGPAIGPARATEILDRVGGIAREAGVAYTPEVDPGSPPARVILDWSARYELTALGAPASSWPARLLSVGVGDKSIGGFSNALLVARPLDDGRRFADRVVVASDGLETSDALVDLAGRLAQGEDSNVTLVHALGREPLKRSRAREREAAVQNQEQMLARTHQGGTNEVLIKPGRAASVIVSAAVAAGASLVVMGARRLDGLRAMGSVSRRVAHQARCSVLLVPPERLVSSA
jgi:nucleotide-binding universal stress UspA family protein